MKIYFKTYGCVLNRYETDIMKAIVKRQGMEIADSEKDADVVVINTCTVKDATEKKTIEYIKRLKASGKPIVIAGCMTVNDYITSFNSPVISTRSIRYITDAIDDAIKGRAVFYDVDEEKSNLPIDMQVPIGRIAIQEGCTNKCTYCQTKLARPKLMSLGTKRIVELIEEAKSKGAIEVDLTGTDVGAYGLDIGTNLSNLLISISRAIKWPPYIRIGMANPHHVMRELKTLTYILRNPFYTFMHIPVQSGSDDVLKHMRRGYTARTFRYIVDTLKSSYDNITIATDVIVGYPTESEEDFEKTIELIETTKPNIVNISKFSPRPGTEAAKLKQIERHIINKRSKELSEIVRRIAAKENEKLIGKEFPVIITENGKNGTSKGRTEFYRQVIIKEKLPIGTRTNITIDGITETSLIGKANI